MWRSPGDPLGASGPGEPHATHDDPARELCGDAEALEVLEPAVVRAKLGEVGRRLVQLYGV